MSNVADNQALSQSDLIKAIGQTYDCFVESRGYEPGEFFTHPGTKNGEESHDDFRFFGEASP